MSPEQCLNKKDIDGRSDIYSMGVVLYEMLTGKKPYEGGSELNIAVKHAKEPVPVLPGELSQYQPIINGMMAKKRRQRISSGVQFMELLEKIERSTTGDFYPNEWEDTVITSFDVPRPTLRQRLKLFINESIRKLKSFFGK